MLRCRRIRRVVITYQWNYESGIVQSMTEAPTATQICRLVLATVLYGVTSPIMVTGWHTPVLKCTIDPGPEREDTIYDKYAHQAGALAIAGGLTGS